MSEQFKALDNKQPRTSKIQLEIKEIAQPTTSRHTKSHHGVDGDGGDASNE
ncbi:hypothetical protein [Microseira sp. BLCC-F43]|jgi:hypothetical protein|uniref:hypothetical protein n=1 Tax=Microseira sp. BLCC-F43 TaxID=3153602 RepID=UPI0035B817A3